MVKVGFTSIGLATLAGVELCAYFPQNVHPALIGTSLTTSTLALHKDGLDEQVKILNMAESILESVEWSSDNEKFWK